MQDSDKNPHTILDSEKVKGEKRFQLLEKNTILKNLILEIQKIIKVLNLLNVLTLNMKLEVIAG